MASMLTKEQTDKVKRIKQLERNLNIDGWMCEGADDDLLIFFNNEKDELFYADYFGNIKIRSCDVPPDVKKYAELEGEIMRICYMS